MKRWPLVSRLQLFYETLRYVRPSQIYLRIWAFAKARLQLYRLPSTPEPLAGRLAHRTDFVEYNSFQNSSCQLLAGQWQFLGKTSSLGWLPAWSKAASESLLWQFNLHYFHYLHLLEPIEQQALCRHWIASHQQTRGVAWHPYTTSLRLISWTKANLGDKEIDSSIYRQATFLYRNMENYHPGNHLLENCRALIFASLYFKGLGEAPLWFTSGCKILLSELKQQVLGDGAYFELSPMYHNLMLELVLDLCNILPLGEPLLLACQEALPKMLGFAKAATHPDGGLALFNDSTLEIAPTTSALTDYATRLGCPDVEPQNKYAEAGFYFFRGENVYLALDAGRIGPDYLPAHAHADIFSFELSLFGERFLTDTGVFEYRAGVDRDYVRSTLAHNTVSVDDISQAEMWSSFRVGKRFPPESIQFANGKNGAEFSGIFRGWTQLLDQEVAHQRILSVTEGQLLVRDQITGLGKHLVVARYHLAPGVTCHQDSATEGTLNHNGRVIRFRSSHPVSLDSSFYSPQFGTKLWRTVLCLRANGALPQELWLELDWSELATN